MAQDQEQEGPEQGLERSQERVHQPQPGWKGPEASGSYGAESTAILRLGIWRH